MLPAAPAQNGAEGGDLASTGPPQRGRGANGQYVYWITQAQPKPETLARLGLRAPADFSAESFRALVVAAHTACGVDLVETAFFKEPHENGTFHNNLLVRSLGQYKWLQIAEHLRKEKVHVDFATHIRTWAEGVVYGCVGSQHKRPEQVDRDPQQWAKEGQPTPLAQFLPSRWQQPGFVRQSRTSNLAFYDMCKKHNVKDSLGLWAKAAELDKAGDRALMQYLLDNDGDAQFAKVLRAREAEEMARRATLTREQLLEEYSTKQACVCTPPGHCYSLAKDLLRRNGLDGILQAEVLGALRSGRVKKRTLCILGGTDCGKTFLFKGLKEVFYTYERPDGGTYQLEDLLGKELVMLNDFEYDAGAKDWMSWSYLKNFLDGGSIPVARPKNRGGNERFKGDAPVLMTAPKEVTLQRRGREVESETTQMQRRIKYYHFTYEIPEEEREEVLKHCGHCAARLFLEGRNISVASAAAGNASGDVGGGGASSSSGGRNEAAQTSAPAAKRRRTAQECLKELLEIKHLTDCGLLSREEALSLKEKLLQGD